MRINELEKSISELQKESHIKWYRCPIEAEEFWELSKRSYAKGFQLALGHLGIWLTIGTLTFLFANSGWWFAALIMLFLHGTIGTFFIAPWQNSHTELFSKPKSWTHFFLRFLSPRLAQFPGLPSEPQLPSSLRLTFSRWHGIGFTESAVTKAAISPGIVHLQFFRWFWIKRLDPHSERILGNGYGSF